jgi:hypothetical protein
MALQSLTFDPRDSSGGLSLGLGTLPVPQPLFAALSCTVDSPPQCRLPSLLNPLPADVATYANSDSHTAAGSERAIRWARALCTAGASALMPHPMMSLGHADTKHTHASHANTSVGKVSAAGPMASVGCSGGRGFIPATGGSTVLGPGSAPLNNQRLEAVSDPCLIDAWIPLDPSDSGASATSAVLQSEPIDDHPAVRVQVRTRTHAPPDFVE